jgi:hypothetical protein
MDSTWIPPSTYSTPSMTHTGRDIDHTTHHTPRGDVIETSDPFVWIFASGNLTKDQLRASQVTLVTNRLPTSERDKWVAGLEGTIFENGVYKLRWVIRIDYDDWIGSHYNFDLERPGVEKIVFSY